tara:strand:- start:609 stop:1640 length:1032 start_codon:yes stop_codon:yes gene_type:complete
MSNIHFVDGWLDQVQEEIIEPDIRIIDPHHHLWKGPSRTEGIPKTYRYLLEDLWSDTESGHKIEKTVYIDCGQEYYKSGVEHFKPVGETEFVVQVAKKASEYPTKAQICGIVGHVNMLIGDLAREVLENHLEVGQGLFRGIRHSGGWDASEEVRNAHSNPPLEHLYLEDDFMRGLEQLSKLNLVFDTWHYHNQIKDLTILARSLPELKIVHDHFGGPLGIGPYKGKQKEIFEVWKEDTSKLAECENVYAKLGGLAMPINGWNWHKRELPATSDELVQTHQKYYMHTIEIFGVNRCMFESNFPVDKQSISYHVLWNAFKKMTKDFSEEDKESLFYKTANDFYSL